MENQQIVVRGAREHNLRNVELTLPRGSDSAHPMGVWLGITANPLVALTG